VLISISLGKGTIVNCPLALTEIVIGYPETT